jgi:hypothetical protein
MNVLYDWYALHQYWSMLGIQLTTDVFVELLDDGPWGPEHVVATEINQLLRVTRACLIKYCCVGSQTFFH